VPPLNAAHEYALQRVRRAAWRNGPAVTRTPRSRPTQPIAAASDGCKWRWRTVAPGRACRSAGSAYGDLASRRRGQPRCRA